MKTILQFNSISSFTTKRLIAEKLTPQDLDKFLIMHSNKTVMKTLGGIRDKNRSIENFQWNLKQWDDHGFGLWMFYLKETKEWIGRGGLRQVEINGKSEIEVGYVLMPPFWHQGFATEITQASLEIAFEILKLHHVVAFTLTTNKASQHVLEKCGLKYEGNFIHHANALFNLYRIKNQRTV